VPRKNTPIPAHVQTASILWRMIWQALVLTAFIIVVLTTLSFIISRMMLESSVRGQLSSVAAIAENALEDTLRTNRERASLLTNNADIRSIVARTNEPAVLSRLLAVLQRDQASLLGIEVYGTQGTLLSSAGETIGLPEQALRVPFHRPVVTDKGWVYYDVFTPIWRDGGDRIGYLALRYDASAALASLVAVTPSLGETAEVILARHDGDDLQIISPSSEKDRSYMLSLGSVTDDNLADFILLRAFNGTEGVARSTDYRGRDALIAYRYLPTLGWSLAMQVERDSALEDVRRIAIAHAAIGTLLLVLAGALASILANQVTQPLRLLTDRVRKLRPGAWTIHRSVHTGDEVEVLEQVVVDMATRLKSVYEKQEGVIEDRTRELTQQYALDSAILESIEYGVIRVDKKGIVSGANPAALALLMEKRDELIGKNAADVIKICGHRGNPLPGNHPVAEVLKTGKAQRSPVNAHFNIRRTDDALLPVMYAVSPLSAQGKSFGAIIVFQDITEERRLDYLKSEFISLASHQLRTPLSALRWYVELFAENKSRLSKEERGYLVEMQNSVNRMVALLTSLLHAAHLEGDNLAPDIQKVNVNQMLTELEEDSRVIMHETGVSLETSMPKKHVMMETDATLLRIVLQNLLSNAAKYTQKDAKQGVSIVLTEDTKSVSFSVKDHGMGIPKSEQQRVFQKFFRAKNVRKQDTDGNGLGLYITHSIVERLGGTIAFESAENKGTTFTIKLPKGVKKKGK
jgi:PAS domain S-box-containing protein